jgi:hypothetical protein
MFEFTAAHFDEVCTCAPVHEQLRTLETRRRAAVKRFWLLLPVAIVLAVAAWWTIDGSGWPTAALVVGILLLFFGAIGAAAPMMKVGEDLKLPVLEQLAAKAGMEYLPGDFTPPLYGEARKTLFGGWLSSERFTDLFHGADPEGRGYAVYEACLQRKAGKNTQIVFSGQIYALHRRPGGEGVTAIVPDRGLLNFFKPAGGMVRVRIEGDEAFEKKFEVYSTHPLEAKRLLFDSDFRQRLLELRQSGRVQVYLGPSEAVVAVSGKDRFEPGSMFRRKTGEERVRQMFEDVRASLGVLGALKAKFG